MVDLTDCIDFCASYIGFNRTESNKVSLAFDITGDTEDKLIVKATGFTDSCFMLEYIELACSSSTARITDGSAGTNLISCLCSDVSCQGHPFVFSDFRGDPLMCLTTDATAGLCLSSSDGYVWGRVQGYWNIIQKLP